MSISGYKINRPNVANAFDLAAALELEKALKAAVKAGHSGFIIGSDSKKIFCSGGDLKAYKKMKSKSEGVASNKKIRRILSQFKEVPLLVIAAVEGDALGGGCELALACDFIFSSSLSRFSFRQVTQGLTPGWGGTENLLARVRPATALDWLSSGRWISAQEGAAAGLVDEILPPGKVAESAKLFLNSRPPELLGIIKSLIYSGTKNEDKIFERLWWSPAHRKAMANTL